MSAPGVGAGAAPVPSASAAPSASVQARFAAAARAFHQDDSSASSAAAQHDAMEVDGSGGSASSFKDLASLVALVTSSAATHCLVVDHLRVAPPDLPKLGNCLNVALTQAERKEAVLEWLPKIDEDGLGAVFVEHQRLHLHFKEHRHLALALKEVPWLVRCGATGSSSWSLNCYGVARHQLPEALRFKCSNPADVPSSIAKQQSAMKELVAEMGIEERGIWQSSSDVYDIKTNPRFAFWVLPRETNPVALVALIERVHRKHKLFGAFVDVQGMNLPPLMRCSECHTLGHSSSTCPLFGGVAVRLVFKMPMSPVVFAGFVRLVPDVRSAMLGNIYINATTSGVTSHKATLFFNADESTPEKKQQFEELLLELGRQAGAMLHQAPHRITMREAERRQECTTCGAREKEHGCPFRKSGPVRSRAPEQPAQQQQQQQQQQQRATQAQGSAAPSKAGGASHAAGSPAVSKQKTAGMCGTWRTLKVCSRNGCTQQHPKDWFPIPNRDQPVCRDFYSSGNCKFQQCKYEHWSLAQEQAKQAAQLATVAPAAAAAAGKSAAAVQPAPAPKKQASNKKKPQQQQQLREGNNNSFAALDAAPASAATAAPATPRKNAPVPSSSLASLASPTRSLSTPGPAASYTASARPNCVLLAFGSDNRAAAAVSLGAAATADNTLFTVTNKSASTNAGRKRKTAGQQQQEEEEEEHKQPLTGQQPRKQRMQPPAAAAAGAIVVDED